MLAWALMKGVLLGLVGFAVFTVLYWIKWFPPRRDTAIGLMAVRAVITNNPFYWTIGALMIVLGCLIMLVWPVPTECSAVSRRTAYQVSAAGREDGVVGVKMPQSCAWRQT
jgi:hypothetical protein